MDQKYNGWTNYETWLVKLWQDNEQGDQEYWRNQAEECVKADGRQEAVQTLANIMLEYYQDDYYDNHGEASGLYTDLINSALRTVNWREIAEHWVNEAADALRLENVEIAE